MKTYLFPLFLFTEFGLSLLIGLNLGQFCKANGLSLLYAFPIIIVWAIAIGTLRNYLFRRGDQ